MTNESQALVRPAPTPVTVLVADDEEAPREQLRAALRAADPALHIVATAANGVDAWDMFLEHEPALCFLDIRMPGLSGIDVARRIGTRAQVVFVSAYGDHALAAFDAGAVDYLLKPIDPPRLAQALVRLRARHESVAAISAISAISAVSSAPTNLATAAAARAEATQALLERLAAELAGERAGSTGPAGSGPARRPAQVLQAAVGREVRLIPVDRVIYFESDTRYTRVVHADGEALIRTPLKELLATLDEQRFWQVHRSVIVAHQHVAAAVRVDDGVMHLTLRGRAETLPVSRHFQGLFKGQ